MAGYCETLVQIAQQTSVVEHAEFFFPTMDVVFVGLPRHQSAHRFRPVTCCSYLLWRGTCLTLGSPDSDGSSSVLSELRSENRINNVLLAS
jgi:hypothetical protein